MHVYACMYVCMYVCPISFQLSLSLALSPSVSHPSIHRTIDQSLSIHPSIIHLTIYTRQPQRKQIEYNQSGMEQVNSCYADSTRGGLGNGTTIADPNAVNICSGGGDSSVPPAYMCADQQVGHRPLSLSLSLSLFSLSSLSPLFPTSILSLISSHLISFLCCATLFIQPFVEPSSGTMMAFAAANMGCCGCYELTFGPAGNPSYYNGELDGETSACRRGGLGLGLRQFIASLLLLLSVCSFWYGPSSLTSTCVQQSTYTHARVNAHALYCTFSDRASK
jgi:hypothetical protein